MPIGQIGSGLLDSFANYVTSERKRQRDAEDQELAYQRELITGLLNRPDINPAHIGRALTDLANLSTSKSRSQKSGKAGFYGETHMPLSGLLSGLQSGLTPAMGDTTVRTPIGSQDQIGMIPARPQEIMDLGEGNFTDQSALMPAPTPEPPKMAQMQYRDVSTEQQPLLKSSDQMAREKGSAAVAVKDMEVEGTMNRIDKYLGDDPAAADLAKYNALGVSPGFHGTTVRQYIDPLDPETPFPGLPTKMGGIMNLNTGQIVANAQMTAYPTSRPPQLVEMAANELFGTFDVRTIRDPRQMEQLRMFINSDRFVEFARRMNYMTQLNVAREWASPMMFQGTDPSTGQAATFFQSPGAASGRGVGLPPVPQSPVAPNPFLNPEPPSPARPTLGPQQPTIVPQDNSRGAAIPNPPQAAMSQRGPVQQAAAQGGPVRTPSGGILAAPTADMRNQAVSLEPVTAGLAEVERMITGINRMGGMTGMAIGVGKRIAGRTGGNDPSLDYQKAVDGMLATYARIAGERGVLVEGDIERARAMLPKIGESPTITRSALNRFKAFLSERLGVLPTPYRPGEGFDTSYRGGRASGAGPAGQQQQQRKLIPGTNQYAVSNDGGKTWVAE